MAAVGAMTEPYHRYVFDLERQLFVGDFDEMYRREDVEGYDSWHQEILDTPSRRVTLALLAGREWASVLDFGCGKGAFTSLLKTDTNRVVGVDASEAAIAKAAARDPRIDFRVLGADGFDQFRGERFELVLAMEVLSYLEDWRAALEALARLGEHLFVTLYLPRDPIGFVKSLDELRSEIADDADIELEALVNRDQLQILAKSRA
jgi:SAM-dependent methyltransferase